jgi:hypothetical protein
VLQAHECRYVHCNVYQNPGHVGPETRERSSSHKIGVNCDVVYVASLPVLPWARNSTSISL